jgi:hypothetical protein
MRVPIVAKFDCLNFLQTSGPEQGLPTHSCVMYMHVHLLLYSDTYRHAARVHTYILSYMVVLISFGFGLKNFLEHTNYKKWINVTIRLWFWTSRRGLSRMKFRLFLARTKYRVNTYSYIRYINWGHCRCLIERESLQCLAGGWVE